MTTKTNAPAIYQTGFRYVLVPQTCISCGVLFALEQNYDARKQEDHKAFYCPNGHTQWYVGKTKEQVALEERDAARELAARESRRRHWAEEDAQYQREKAERERRSAAAYKGHATRIRNRIRNGVCPAGCNRHFDNIQRHIATKHPDFQIPEPTE